MKITRWLRDGHSGLDVETTEDLLTAAAASLDSSYAHDIVGECAFVGEDGKVYVGTVIFNIEEASEEYAQELLEESK